MGKEVGKGMKLSQGVISSEVPWWVTLAQFHRRALDSIDKTYTVLMGNKGARECIPSMPFSDWLRAGVCVC